MNIKKFLQDSNKNWWVVFALSVFIIYESVVIIDRLSNRDEAILVPPRQEDVSKKSSGQVDSEVLISITDSGAGWFAGKTGRLQVVFTPLKDISLDGLDLLLEYDPESLFIESLETTDLFDTVARKLIQPENNRVIVSLFELTKKEGISFSSGDKVVLLTIDAKPKTGVKSTFVKLINKTESQPGSQLIEAKTGEQILFSESQYLVNISE
jgi:hypothetical protein